MTSTKSTYSTEYDTFDAVVASNSENVGRPHDANHSVLNLYLLFSLQFNSVFPQFCNLKKRIDTFLHSSYPHYQPSPEELAESGFFYKGILDATQCYNCGSTLAEWTDDDSPLIEHKRFAPSCKHVLKQMLSKNLLQESEIELLQEARNRINYLSNFCKDSYLPFNIAMKLGHNNNIIVYHLGKKMFLHDFTMPNIEIKEFISELIELEINLDDHEKEQIAGIYDQLILCTATSSIDSASNVPRIPSAISNNQSVNVSTSACSSNEGGHLNRSRSQDDLEKLKEENSSMIVKSLCRVCESSKADVIGLPCGHIARCAPCWRKQDSKVNCPICGEPISESIHVFRS